MARDWTVSVGGAQLTFTPQHLLIAPGDTVTFRNLGGFHNVMADNGGFRCARGCDGDGRGGSGAPSNQIWFATVSFEQSGRFGYFCEPHGAPSVGMFGSITVAAPAVPPVIPTAIPGTGVLAGLLLICAVLVSAGFGLRRATRRAGVQLKKPR